MIRAVGAIFVVLGALMAWRTFRPNTFCGVRYSWTLADEVVWYRSNGVAGQFLMIWGALLVTFGAASPRALFALVLGPIVPFVLLTAFHSAWLYRERHGRFTVIPLPLIGGKTASSWGLDCVLLVIPVIGLWLTARLLHQLPTAVPIYFDFSGNPTLPFGSKGTLLSMQYVTLVLWLILAIIVRLHRTVSTTVVTGFFFLRLGTLTMMEAGVLASVSYVRGWGHYGYWHFASVPAIMLLASLALVVSEAMVAPADALVAVESNEMADEWQEELDETVT